MTESAPDARWDSTFEGFRIRLSLARDLAMYFAHSASTSAGSLFTESQLSYALLKAFRVLIGVGDS